VIGASGLRLELSSELDCPVCGFGGAFVRSGNCDVCSRCEWIDDPDVRGLPDTTSSLNGSSMTDARLAWPARIVEHLRTAPLATLSVGVDPVHSDRYDILIDGVPMPEIFPAAKGLKSVVGPWPGKWSLAPLVDGRPGTKTGRVRLYVCHICGGDDYETALTADIALIDERCIWSRIGSEVWVEDDDDSGHFLNVRRASPSGFAFDGARYRDTLRPFA
jgi:Cysteine-rich CPCC